MPRPRKPASSFRYFNSSPEVIRLVVLMYVRFPLSLRNVEDLLFERGIDICHETVRLWWNRFGPLFAGDIRRQRVSRMRGFRHWRWHPDEMYVKLNGEMVYLWRAVDHEGEVLDSEPPRVCRRLQLLRRWSLYEQDDEQVCARGPRASGTDGAGRRARSPIAKDSDSFHCLEDRLRCGSAWKKDPGSGVIGVEKGPLIPVV